MGLDVPLLFLSLQFRDQLGYVWNLLPAPGPRAPPSRKPSGQRAPNIDATRPVNYSPRMFSVRFNRPVREDNLLCAVLVLETAVVVKTVLHRWELLP